jgi:hypothetical protein
MAEENSTSWRLDLDTEGAESGIEAVKGGLEEIGAK